MAYTFSPNNNPATGAEAMFILKERLKSAGWTIPRSSDGITFNSSGDQITSGGTGANGMNNVRAWFVAQQPSGGSAPYSGVRQLCIQRNSASGANTSQQWRIKYSVSTGFTGGSPGILQTPSATDEKIMLGGGTDASPTYAGLFGTADGGYRYHCGADNASPFGFYSVGYATGISINASHSFWMEPMTSGSFPYGVGGSQDNDPFVFYLDNNTAGANGNFGNLTIETTGPQGYLKQGLAGEGFVRIPAITYVTHNGTAFQYAANNGAAGVNPHNTKDDLLPLHLVRRSALTAPVGYKGRGHNILVQASVQRNSGDLYTVTNPGDYIAIGGGLAFPWPSGTTPQQ